MASGRTLYDILSLQHDEVDEDPGIALTSLITTAVHDEQPKHNLASIVDAVKQSGCASSLEPLTIIPLVVSSPESSADDLIGLMSQDCSAKEVVMAVEEVVESLDRAMQTGEDEEHGRTAPRTSTALQLARLIRAYAVAIPRLPKWKKSPEETLASRLSELNQAIQFAGQSATPHEGRTLVVAISEFALALSNGADEKTKISLQSLIQDAIETFANATYGNLARKAFMIHFSRLVVPQSEASSESGSQDVLTSTWRALHALGATTSKYESHPSLASLVLLAHDPSYTFSMSTLTTFYPTIIFCIQSNFALDEVLYILISSLARLRSAVPRPELNADLTAPLIHLLPHVASNHQDPDIRHYTFRAISLVLGLSPSPLRFRFLQDLLSDVDLPAQMRVATVGLLKEAVLEGLTSSDKNIFASPHLFTAFGPLVLRPQPPDLFDSVLLDDFLESPEALRLVECLGFYYVLLLRDVRNLSGVRDADSLNNVESSLLRPLRKRLMDWEKELEQDTEQEHDHDAALQLDILHMWLERVQDAIDRTRT
ncbi:hypothetical protein BD309DRAFT_962945 [Dichomitus squalens]|uniref:Uncharacterized protein n=1 Tax=Dichomitus squalens TaxID=114155 RepID=A0A4V2JZS0_9APHY|nr:hypothetical protein BD311DRAFT_699082 [Dichomitus squalens]TBU42467.1 hypothetical protein BD309DRAFT_962945 [Dichomitus squalens]